LRRYWGLGLIAVTTAVVVPLQPFDNGPVIRADGVAYHAWTYTLLRGDLNFRGLDNDTYAFHETRPGYWWNSYPPGVALARLPVMAFLVARGDQFGRPTRAEHAATAVLSALALFATAALLFSTCRVAGAGYGPANVAVLGIVFGTGLFHYATYDASYSHCWTALGMAGLLALVARSRSRGGRIAPVALVLLAAWLILVRNTNVFALATLGVSYFFLAPRYLGVSMQRAFRNSSYLAAGSALSIGVQVALNSFAFGHFTVASYYGRLFAWDQPMQWSVLTSVREHGLFPYYPVAILFVFVPFAIPRLRPAATGFAAIVLVYTLLYGFWNAWNLGASFGHRGFVDILPLGVPLFAVALTELPRWPRRIIVVATLLATYVTLSLMAGYWRRTVPYHLIAPEVYWAHVVGEEQLLAVPWRSF